MKKKTGAFETSAAKRLFSGLKPYRLPLVISLAAAAVSVAGQLVIPVVTGMAIDEMVGGGQGLFKLLAAIAALAGISAAAQWVLSLCNNKVAYAMSEDLRNAAIGKIGRLPLSYLDSHPSGDLVSRIIADVDIISDGLLLAFTQFFSGVLTILGTLGFMFAVNWVIALVVVAVTPLSMVAAGFIAKGSFKYFRQAGTARGEETALLTEAMGGLKVISAFGAGEEYREAFSEKDEALKEKSLISLFYSSLTNPTTRFVNGVVYAGVALSGALFAVAGRITVGQLSSFLAYANQYTKPFNEISGVVSEMQNALACASRLFAFIDAEEEEPDAEGARVLTDAENDGTVEIDDVYFSYDKKAELIRGFNLKVASGQRVAIVGPTGCGKTTVINLLMRFYDVDRGSISVSGTDIRQMTRHSLRSAYGMVLQDTWLKTGTIAENIAYGRPDASRGEIIEAARRARAHGFIKRLPNGYDTLISGGEGHLSQGEKQLLCIARVMLALPPMLILDEATSSIDTRTEMKIQSAFAEMMEGRTSFIVAHRLSTIKNADIILVMRDGQIIETGSHEELLAKKGFYSKLYLSQWAGSSEG